MLLISTSQIIEKRVLYVCNFTHIAIYNLVKI